MRSSLFLLFLLVCTVSSAEKYYVSVYGNDNNPGSLDQPYATWQKGFNTVLAGDTLYIRGGTYYPEGTKYQNFICGVVQVNHDGTSTSPICVFAYPGENPILDCRNMTQPYSHLGIYFENSDFWHLKGLTITRSDQVKGFGAAGVRIYSGNNLVLENIVSHNNGGSGIQIVARSEGNLLLNCDTYSNYDPFSSVPGENADGIEIADIYERNNNERANTMIGCRSWENSDDGFDHYQCEGILLFEECWAWRNGYIPGTTTAAGNGDGFKLGRTVGTPESVTQRKLIRCISHNNRTRGFSQNGANVLMEFYHNIASYNTNHGYLFYTYNNPDKIRNNVSFKNGGHIYSQPRQVIDNNSWQSGLTLSESDFISIDETQLSKPRKDDGSLPEIDFLHPSFGSQLIDAGADTRLPFYGNAPDIGVYEIPEGDFHQNVVPDVSISFPTKGTSFTPPAMVTVSVEANDPDGSISKIELYNGSVKLAETYSAPYSFSLKDLPAGNYNLKAVATDNLKASSVSSILQFSVVAAYNEKKEYFNLYPNPNNGQFTVDFSSLLDAEKFIITIVDLIGKTVYREEFSAVDTVRQFDLSHLNSGIYVLMITASQILLTQKFIKN